MGEKDGGEKKAAADGGGKKEEGPTTVVLKMDLHCEGCAKKVKRAIGHFEGVEKVKADCSDNKLTVTGNVDPAWLRDRVEYKTKKKVVLISPQPKKDAAPAPAGEKKPDEKSDKKPDEKKADGGNKPPVPAVSTVLMKIKLHCDGCAHKVKRMISKNIAGVDKVKTDLDKDLVTVIGTMNVKELTAFLKEKLKRAIDVIPPPAKKDAGGDKKEAAGDKKEAKDEKKESKEGGGDKKPEAAAPPADKKKEGEATKVVEVNKLEYQGLFPQTHYAAPMAMYYNQSYSNQDYGVQPAYPYMYNHMPDMHYRQGPPPPPPTYMNMNDQMFSDENPNGCSVM